MMKLKVFAAVIFGAIGFYAALSINTEATARDEAATREECGVTPSVGPVRDAWEYCASGVRNRVNR
jgi:hypothetical protein